ncbi:MAG: recombination protein NinG [Candidatus Thorarchaeota archaeon]
MNKNHPKIKKAWALCSKYIRLKECYESTGSYEQGICFTCRTLTPFYNLDAGHFIPGRHFSVLFVEELIHIQCKVCNQVLNGNYKRYEEIMNYIYGKEKVEEFKQLKYKHVKMYEYDIDEIIKLYKNKLMEIGFYE